MSITRDVFANPFKSNKLKGFFHKELPIIFEVENVQVSK
jgi:hypothetical protein